MKNPLKSYLTNAKKRGVSLIEILVATGIAAIVITSILSSIGGIYVAQKKNRFSQNFYSESRILMERIAQIARNNTIDYDRYYCNGENTCDYPGLFYKDTDGDGTSDRNLGGMTALGVADDTTKAFDNTDPQATLYLINGARNMKTAIRNKTTVPADRVEVQRQLGADTDNDGIADLWGPYNANGGDLTNYASGDINVVWEGGVCNVIDGPGPANKHAVLGNSSEDLCHKATDWQSISPKSMKVTDLDFQPSPNRDPFLSFRIDEAQIHPHVFINMAIELRDPAKNGFDPIKQPKIAFQTMASSRVFGDTRR